MTKQTYVRNPETGRLIKVGGPTYNRLKKQKKQIKQQNKIQKAKFEASDDDLVSLVLWTIDAGSADIFASKEYSNSSLWPYLNITYHTANTAPTISIAEPQDGSTYGYNESLNLNFSVNDADDNLDSCWYNLNEGGNISLASCANATFDIAEGSQTLDIYANDSFGHVNSSTLIFADDTTPPVITLLGDNPQEIEIGIEDYNESYATAEDNIDEDLTGSIIIDNSLNCKK